MARRRGSDKRKIYYRRMHTYLYKDYFKQPYCTKYLEFTKTDCSQFFLTSPEKLTKYMAANRNKFNDNLD